MKLFFVLTSLLAAAQAQFTIGAPSSGTTLVAGQNVTVQIIEPIDTSAEAGEEEVSLVIGIAPCGSSGCPAPSDNLGEIFFIGKYQSQGEVGNTLNTFENFSFVVPSEFSGQASIQVQHAFLTTLPGFESRPEVEFANTPVQIQANSGSFKINPNGDSSKCVEILGGNYADGTPVDIFDCNGSATQIWKWNGNALTSVNPADGSQWCLDAGIQSQWANGVLMKIWQCFSTLPQQTWTRVPTGTIQLASANFCLDLTNGVLTNRNVLQIWTCFVGNTHQIWTVTSV